MDRIRTLLLARTHVVVMDPELVASASTRPSREADAEALEDELAQLGYVMSLDLAAMMRRLPRQTIQEMRAWIHDTLAKKSGAHRPHVPLFRHFPEGVPSDTPSLYLKRILSWLATVPDQPCPWCTETKTVGALDPCGHLVCRNCWDGTGYTSCPICHRRVTLGEPFIVVPVVVPPVEKVTAHSGNLTLVQLAFDPIGTTRERFKTLLGRVTPLSPDDRDEVEAVIDTIGPKTATWLPPRIPIKETMALACARLWLIAPDRSAMVAATQEHVKTATDVLRIACVLMGGAADLVEPVRMGPLPRALRRALLEALERIPLENLVEDMMRHRSLWKRIGERLHVYEYATKHERVTFAFATLRGTNLATATFGSSVREQAVRQPFVYVENDHVKPIAWAGPIEDALRAGNPRSALVRLTHRPGELLRRADHLIRTAQSRQADALQTLLKAIELSAMKAPPALMLTLAAHVARRGRPWQRRVFFPKGEVLRAWGAPDRRVPLRGDAIAVIVGSIRRQLCLRAEVNKQFPRAVIDRALVDVTVPINERTSSRSKLAWPRGSELALPDGQRIRLFLHWEQPHNQRTDLDLSIALYDSSWRHVATCDYTNLIVGGRTGAHAAVHSGDLTDAPPPFGASEFIDLHLEQLTMEGARHAVMSVFSYNAVPFDQLPHAFAGVMVAPEDGAAFDPRAVMQRFDLRGKSLITVPLTIDLSERRLRWLDVHVAAREELRSVGGYRAALAHIGRDFADLISTHARPTMWDVACVHAAARANVVYIRERDGTFTVYRRRDNESKVARLGRMMSGAGDDGRVPAVPLADAPTWFALMSGMKLPRGSVGYALDSRGLPNGIERQAAGDLIAELAPRT
jgi:hypothetical protein